MHFLRVIHSLLQIDFVSMNLAMLKFASSQAKTFKLSLKTQLKLKDEVSIKRNTNATYA